MKNLKALSKKSIFGLAVILTISAFLTGCMSSGDDEEQEPSTLEGKDSKAQSETVQDPDTAPGDRDASEEIAETDMKPVNEASAAPSAEANPVNPSPGTNPDVPPAGEIPDATSTEAIQRSPEDPLPPDQSVASESAVSLEWELLTSADVDRDGLEEAIYLDKTEIDSGSVTLCICDSEGNVIWSEEAGIPHTGWNSIFLMEQGGTHYLLQYNPYIEQGYGTYTYILFVLEGADENVISGDLIDFDTTGTKELDVPRMVSFAETVNSLLAESILLISSEGGEFTFGPSSAEPFFERYSWLDLWPELYEEGDDLGTRLYKYSDYAVAKRLRYN